MTFASHPERQFMQYLRGAGWIEARALPPSARLVKKLLQKGWIEQQEQGPKNEVFFRLTERGLEAKKYRETAGLQMRRAPSRYLARPEYRVLEKDRRHRASYDARAPSNPARQTPTFQLVVRSGRHRHSGLGLVAKFPGSRVFDGNCEPITRGRILLYPWSQRQ